METWIITFYYTPDGGSEVDVSQIDSSRTLGWTGTTATAAIDTSDYDTDDVVRANFRTLDQNTNEIFSYSRSVTIP